MSTRLPSPWSAYDAEISPREAGDQKSKLVGGFKHVQTSPKNWRWKPAREGKATRWSTYSSWWWTTWASSVSSDVLQSATYFHIFRFLRDWNHQPVSLSVLFAHFCRTMSPLNSPDNSLAHGATSSVTLENSDFWARMGATRCFQANVGHRSDIFVVYSNIM